MGYWGADEVDKSPSNSVHNPTNFFSDSYLISLTHTYMYTPYIYTNTHIYTNVHLLS